MSWKMSSLALLLIVCSVAATPAAAQHQPVDMWCKMNWDAGSVRIGGVTYNLTYKDAHVTIATKGIIEDEDPAPRTADGGFSKPTPNVHIDPADPNYHLMTIDWSGDQVHGVTGMNHIGFGCQIWTSSYGQAGAKPEIRSATLTNVTCPAVGYERDSLGLGAPVPFSWEPVNSANCQFSIYDMSVSPINPVFFRNMSFYKTSVEPPLEDLNDANFPSLPKTWLQNEPDFALAYGQVHPVTVQNVDAPEWLLCYYETEWAEPTISAWVGQDVFVQVRTWVAGELVPEPAALTLLALGGLALLRRRRR